MQLLHELYVDSYRHHESDYIYTVMDVSSENYKQSRVFVYPRLLHILYDISDSQTISRLLCNIHKNLIAFCHIDPSFLSFILYYKYTINLVKSQLFI